MVPHEFAVKVDVEVEVGEVAGEVKVDVEVDQVPAASEAPAPAKDPPQQGFFAAGGRCQRKTGSSTPGSSRPKVCAH